MPIDHCTPPAWAAPASKPATTNSDETTRRRGADVKNENMTDSF
jgi:hypothetical protein